MTEGANRSKRIWAFLNFSNFFTKSFYIFLLFASYLCNLCRQFFISLGCMSFLSLTIAIMAIIAIMYSGVTGKSIPHVLSSAEYFSVHIFFIYWKFKSLNFLFKVEKVDKYSSSQYRTQPPLFTFIFCRVMIFSWKHFQLNDEVDSFAPSSKNKQSYIIFGYCYHSYFTWNDQKLTQKV